MKIASAVAWVAAALVVPSQVPQRPTFRTGTDLVRVDVMAVDHGRPIAGLTAEDFEVRDNGVVQHLDLATASDHVSVAIVLDLSSRGATEELKRATRTLVGALEPKDRGWLLSSAQPFSLRATPNHPGDLLAALDRMRSSGPLNLWDTIFGGATLVAGDDGRAVVIVLSAGNEPFARVGWLDEDRAMQVLRRGDVTVSAVQPRSVLVEPTALERAAKVTGGVVLEAEHNSHLAEQFTDLLDRFRLGYILTFTPTGVTHGDGWHKLSVKLTSHTGSVKAREGYFSDVR